MAIQDAQNGRLSHPPNPGAPRRVVPQARPQRAKLKRLRFKLREDLNSLNLSLNLDLQEAGGLFQHPAKSGSAGKDWLTGPCDFRYISSLFPSCV